MIDTEGYSHKALNSKDMEILKLKDENEKLKEEKEQSICSIANLELKCSKLLAVVEAARKVIKYRYHDSFKKTDALDDLYKALQELEESGERICAVFVPQKELERGRG